MLSNQHTASIRVIPYEAPDKHVGASPYVHAVEDDLGDGVEPLEVELGLGHVQDGGGEGEGARVRPVLLTHPPGRD